jgi:hypothetical protein
MSTFAKLPQGGGKFFKPAEYQQAAAFLLEPTHFEPQVAGKFGPKDILTADITVFDRDNEVQEVLQGAKIEASVLVRDLKGILGQMTVAKLDQVPTSAGNPAWVWRPVSPAVESKIAEYVEGRNSDFDNLLND